VGAVGPVFDWRCSGQIKSGQLWAVSLACSNISSTMEPSAPSGGVAVSASAGRNELQNKIMSERASTQGNARHL
jgi:hypothetical protein